MPESSIQANEEVDNVYQDGHLWMSSPRPNIEGDMPSHLLANHGINDEVDFEELYVWKQNCCEEILSLESECKSNN